MGKGFGLSSMATALLALLLAALLALPAAPGVQASEQQSLLRIADGQGIAKRNITVGLSKSMIVELPRDVRDVMVSDPKKLDAVVSTSRRVYLIGMEVGQANAFFFDTQGNQILTLEVKIERDLTGISQMLKKLMPGSDIRLEAVNDNIVLSGTVANPADASRAADLAARMVGDKEKVLNMIAADAKEQVLLKVTVVEMERNIIKQLGVDLNALVNSGNFSFTALSTLQFPFNGRDLISTATKGATWQTPNNSINAVVR
ncbi:MAG: pilus assembly protein N-terminal domain-containing protein, partial [Pseudomonadota bacterium]|nr:pilus assembly protein N-terminal domain-containing protein [Pseudomonadota bacterium]